MAISNDKHVKLSFVLSLLIPSFDVTIWMILICMYIDPHAYIRTKKKAVSCRKY